MDIKTVEICCAECRVSFWITKSHDSRLRKDHNTFYCPCGHKQSYEQKTESERAIEERDRYKRWYESEQNTSGRLARSNSALRGVITRNKKK